jgi:spermidine synthase/MFS family permease
VFLVSAGALAYEILLMRLFSIIQWHHFAYMIISLALLGYGASGSVVVLLRGYLVNRFARVFLINLALFGFSAIACYLAAQQIPFNPEEVLWDWQQPLRLMTVYFLLALPFFFASNSIALALTHFKGQVSTIYAADLLGAGAGSLGIVALLFAVFPGTAVKYLGALGLVAAFIAARELRLRSLPWQVAALVGIVAVLALPAEWLAPRPSPYKEMSQTLRIPGMHVIAERSSPLGMISVVESGAVPLRHAPGLSLHAAAPLPEQLAVFTDADGLTAIDRNPRRRPLDYLEQLTSALPYHLADPAHVLILGAGGGTAIQQALNHGVGRVEAVELNPQIIGLMTAEYAEWSGQLYTRPGVEIYAGDARGFITRSATDYDLIQIALVDAFGASSAGLHALNESHLYTTEALQEYVEHLSADGFLAITRWIRMPPRGTLKLFATAVDALRRTGVPAPESQLVLIRGWQTSTLLVKNGRITRAETARLRDFCRARAFDVAWYPGMRAEEANRFNILDRPLFFRAAVALAGDGAGDFEQRYKFDIRPTTDDRPYFFHFFKWGVLPEILALRGQGGMPLLEAGYLVLVATLLQALLLGTAFILLPLAVLGTRGQRHSSVVRMSRIVAYFFAIGLAFLFIEIAFIQKFILFLHHPLYAVAVVLTAFLVFAGLGSHSTARSGGTVTAGKRRARIAIGCIALLGLGYTALLGPLFSLLQSWPAGLRILVSTALIAPMAFCMGMPFPLGLAHVGTLRPDYIPWAWGINGCASVLSAVLATLLAIQFGFGAVIILAILLYLLAAAMFP